MMAVDPEDCSRAGESIVETEANNRKNRLAQMRAVVQKGGAGANQKSGEPLSNGLGFRSYEPTSLEKSSTESFYDMHIVETEIKDQLKIAEDTSLVENVDIAALAPRKIDWDLKRDVAERMEKLDRRTQRAIAQLIKERLVAGKAGLDVAVNSGAYNELQPDD